MFEFIRHSEGWIRTVAIVFCIVVICGLTALLVRPRIALRMALRHWKVSGSLACLVALIAGGAIRVRHETVYRDNVLAMRRIHLFAPWQPPVTGIEAFFSFPPSSFDGRGTKIVRLEWRDAVFYGLLPWGGDGMILQGGSDNRLAPYEPHAA